MINKVLFICLIIAIALFWSLKKQGRQKVMNDKSKFMQKATFAGGCFWCVETTFKKAQGVTSVVSGYIGGSEKDANYERVSMGTTGHYEAIEITFDSSKTSYADLLEIFFREVDVTDSQGQFADRGSQYKPAIFYHTDQQKIMALTAIEQLEQKKILDKEIMLEVLPATKFFAAEEYHQDYAKKNPIHYSAYRIGSGRQTFVDQMKSKFKKDFFDFEDELEELSIEELNSPYAKPEKKLLLKKLDDLQFHVTQNCGTEPAFNNKYWNNKEPGIYVDIVTGEPLFSSTDKFDSGTGWPSFTKPIENNHVTEHADDSYGMHRVEVKSKAGASHLGHVFNDGPSEKGGLRYCINSASLRFIPVKELKVEGYEQYLDLFN